VVKTFGVCDFSRLAVTDWRLRRWRLWFLALMTATPTMCEPLFNAIVLAVKNVLRAPFFLKKKNFCNFVTECDTRKKLTQNSWIS